jgi:hypothetical protein
MLYCTSTKSLEGKGKLAKLDFLLRYPSFMQRCSSHLCIDESMKVASEEQDNIKGRMI